ncbi:hypothetical protein SY27_12370 [Flavobacterium sp. 316]|uniref:Chromosome partitioning protein ParA n=1 Tax=Flavobacterium sediminilitoris TaxID=2024526 RepID=A0ABY4HQ08_9FLAO|nr:MULTISPECIES: hypothetical protein [Flavobacterium]KIX20685.1 hypothetical protein SY27_12370 [Flavobacterium sp. 316]UOX34716.1 hypothetical protein LXD69_04230 [Flavobacterium sediminilitoris]
MATNKTNFIRISFAFLAVLLALSFLGYYHFYSEYNIVLKKSQAENKLLQNQFDEILKKYDSLSLSIEDEEALEVKEAIKDAIENTNDNSKINFSDSNNKSLEDQINQIKIDINNNSDEIVRINEKIQKDKKTLTQLESLKSNDVRIRHDKLSAINVTVRGVKILSDLYSKKREKKIQQIRVCFTLQGNEFIRQGNKDIYIQVVNPKNQIISAEDTSIIFNNIKLVYSAKTEALYNQKDVDVCSYVNLEPNKTIKGKYIINIYNSFSKIGTTIFQYD